MIEKNTKMRVLLLESEQERIKMQLPSPTTITYFEFDENCSDREKLIARVEKKLEAIVLSNPWLGGKLVSTDEGIALEYSSKPKLNLTVLKNIGASPGSPSPKFASHPAMRDVYVRPGVSIINTNQPVFKVTLILERDHWILAVSLSHTIGDGCTYYRIYAMFDDHVAMTSLIVERVHEFDKHSKQIMHHEGYWHKSIARCIGVSKGVLTNLLSWRASQYGYNIIDKKEIDRIKQESDIVVSTNDIVCSIVYNKFGCNFGLMYVDFRGRIDSISINNAGNYSSEVLVSKAEFSCPQTIRQMVSELSQGLKPCAMMPSILETMQFNTCMITNWCRFYHHLTIFGASSYLHLPYFHTSQFKLRHWRACAVIFMANATDIGVMWIGPDGESLMKDTNVFCK